MCYRTSPARALGTPGPDDTIDGNASQASTTYYTRDNEGDLVGIRAPSGRYYYLFDGLGSIVGLVNSTSSKINSYSYDPYGEKLTASQTISNPWRYAAGQYDGSTGLTKFGVRYYNPAEARFTQRDPSGKDLAYAYASGNPINHTDPTGQFSWGDALKTVGLVAAGAAVFATGWGAVALGAAAVGFDVGGGLANGDSAAEIGISAGLDIATAGVGPAAEAAGVAGTSLQALNWTWFAGNVAYGLSTTYLG